MQSVQREKGGAAIALGHIEHAQSGRAVFGGPQCGPSSVQHLSALGMRPEVAAPVAAQIEEEVRTVASRTLTDAQRGHGKPLTGGSGSGVGLRLSMGAWIVYGYAG